MIFGNCSLSLAPVRPGKSERLAEFLSYVEAIPMEVLRTVEFGWETVPQYIDQLDHDLGVNVGNLIGHTAVRYYVMGDECQKRTATDAEIKAMQDVVRDGMQRRALWACRCRAIRATTIRRACMSRRCGPTRRKSSPSATCCANSAPASSKAAAATASK